MTTRRHHGFLIYGWGALTFVLVAGCGLGGTGLPSSVDIELPDGTSVSAELGSGAKSLANSKWQFFRTAGNAQGAAFVTIVFGPEGNLESFEDNTFAAEIFGDNIKFDGNRYDTRRSGVRYAASTYGAETSDASGFTFEGRLTAFFAGIQAATATATATGVRDPDNENIMRGTFAFSSRVTLGSFPQGNIDDEFNFIAELVE